MIRFCASALSTALLVIQSLSAFADQKQGSSDAEFALTIDSIMRGPELVGYEPQSVRWTADGKRLFFEWKEARDRFDEEFDTWVVNGDGSSLRRLTKEDAKHARPSSGDESLDRRRVVYIDDGDVYLYDDAKSSRRALTVTSEAESNARFTHDERSVTFVRGNNLYRLSLASGSLEQLTDIVAVDDKSPRVTRWDEKKPTASQKYLEQEERELLDTVERRASKREKDEAKGKKENPRKPLKLDAKQRVNDLQLTPDGLFVIASLTTDADKQKKAMVPSYVTESAYTQALDSREKVGDLRPVNKLASIHVTTGEVKWLQHGLKQTKSDVQTSDRTESENKSAAEVTTASKLPEQREKGERTDEQKEVAKEVDRDIAIQNVVFSDDGTRAIIAIRSVDNKDRWIMRFDPVTATATAIVSMHDDAWIRSFLAYGFLGDGTVYYVSEASGYAHLYTVPHGGGSSRALTGGEWEVLDLQRSVDGQSFYLQTNRDGPHVNHTYHLPAAGGKLRRLTEAAGQHNGVVSPDGRLMADIYSYSNQPPELFVGLAGDAKGRRRVTTSPAPEFGRYKWIEPPIVSIAARDGAQIAARIYKPAGYQAGGPAVIFVHGAGYLQNVHRWWSSYYREYMFHHLLMERGYLVLDIDYRGSAGYGRAWRTGIYRHMGGKDLDDHIDAAKWLVNEHGADAKRLGIYGGSYGGFITLMALFTQPDVFQAGAALRPVTDWAHYNHGYTSNILNSPQDDREAYRRSSPIYFAEGLKNHLLLLHGMVDVNVHYQDSVRLAQRLIELRKENWELAGYPVEDHTFIEPASWADEYKRILKLFETTIGKARGR